MQWNKWFRWMRDVIRLDFGNLKQKKANVAKEFQQKYSSKAVQGVPIIPVVPSGKTASSIEMDKLLKELREAHLEWDCARKRLDYALEDEEIDYAIFALETAEKRYSMLLKQAKAWKVTGRGIHAAPVHYSARHKPARKLGG